MTTSQLILLALVVLAAVVAGYFIGRWASEREYGTRAARPNPLPAPEDDATDASRAESIPQPRQRRGAPPPANAGGEHEPAPIPPPRRHSTAPPPASASDDGPRGGEAEAAAPRRARRGPPPPASAGLIGDSDRES